MGFFQKKPHPAGPLKDFEDPRETWDGFAAELSANAWNAGMTAEDLARAGEKRREAHEEKQHGVRITAHSMLEAPPDWLIKARSPRQFTGEHWDRYQERVQLTRRLGETEAAYRQACASKDSQAQNRYLDQMASFHKALNQSLDAPALWTIGKNY